MAENGQLSDEEPRSAADPNQPLLDRSRARLRLPENLLADALTIAYSQALAHLGGRPAGEVVAPETVDRLSPIMDEGRLDPVANELLNVVNQASMMVAVDVSYGSDLSAATIWATPRLAVSSNAIDPTLVELELVSVTQLPQLLALLTVMQSPSFVGRSPLSVDVQSLSNALSRSSRDEAVEVLAGDGLDREQALLVLDLQLPQIRRWRINSSWSTEDGPDVAELRGLDAGKNGQWLETSTAGRGDGPGLRTYTPLGHGEMMSALRTVLPRNWMGKPLNRRAGP